MGFGCNAAGVVGCRIIDSKRERLIAMLTNALVPCNGRFPTLIALITLFFAVSSGGTASLMSALILSGLIVLSVIFTLVCSKFLSLTFLKGAPSSFTLELPPYRSPEVGKVIIRSVLDRTLFVLGRSVAFAAPAGIILWLLANIKIQSVSLLAQVSDFLDPLGRLMGMDGAVLVAFLLALPASEIFIPIVLMIYNSGSSLVDYSSMSELMEVLSKNGWTKVTAICVIIFMLFHFPCATTLMTVKKESGSFRWMLLAAVLPTVLGMSLCILISFFSRIF